ncbi:MAG: translation initiation factor IF-2 [Minisyncoccota bacterium]
MKKQTLQPTSSARPPVVVIMGHVDHGKSTLLDFIRKSNIVAGEAGGITQHLSAYEVVHTTAEKTTKRITFLDTPGHEAFSQMRGRGTRVADVAVLVVSAEDGVKTQTKEALHSILDAKIPYVIAINKIDKPTANIERVKNSLVENEIYIEGYGGEIPVVAISAKTGEGVPELLDMVLLVADLQNLKGDPGVPAEGIVIEAHIDPRKGTSATLIIKNGTLRKNMVIVSDQSIAPVRAIEDFAGTLVPIASFSSPIRITGFNKVPAVGAVWRAYLNRNEAERAFKASQEKSEVPYSSVEIPELAERVSFPLIIKTDASGTLEAVKKEVEKLSTEKILVRVIHTGVGTITENDLKAAAGGGTAAVVGFNVKVDAQARAIAERTGTPIVLFDIIYKLTEWLAQEIALRTPKETTAEIRGRAQILRLFGESKHKQVIGGRVTEGILEEGATLHLIRRGTEIGTGKLVELQQQKLKTEKVLEGAEFGALVESKMEIATGDVIEAVAMIER